MEHLQYGFQWRQNVDESSASSSLRRISRMRLLEVGADADP